MTIAITHPTALAGFKKATDLFNATLPADATPLTVEQYATARLEELGKKYADQHLVRVISPREFLGRFPAQAIKNIVAASQVNADLFKYLRLLEATSVVELDHPETTGGIALLVQAGLLKQAEADVILEM